MIYCIGNSHVNFFTDTHPGAWGEWKSGNNDVFKSYGIGPVIAYNFTTNHLPKVMQAISSIDGFNFEKDYIMLVVGEVDCRWHLPKQANEQKREVKDVVEECVDRFFISMSMLLEQGYNVVGWGSHPSTVEGHCDNLSQPIFGDCKTRNMISVHFERHYRQKCLENNIPFISILNDIIDDNGITRMEFFLDYCHLKTSPMINHVLEQVKQKDLV
jgi:hypothetical protein